MKANLLKKYLIKQSIVSLVVVVVCGVFFGGMYLYWASIDGEIEAFDKEVEQMKRDISQSQQTNKAVIEAYEAFEKLDPKYLTLADPIATSAGRLRAAEPVVEAIRRDFKLSDINVTFSTLEREKLRSFANKATGIRNKLNLRILAATDEIFLSALMRLRQDLPGYVQIKAMNFSRRAEVTDDYLSNFLVNNKPLELVTGDVQVDWVTLEYDAELVKNIEDAKKEEEPL